jgi:hypothetical protein
MAGGRCQYHPERDGIGVCMRCRAVICSECSTRIEGVNHCVRCLAALRAATPKPRLALGTGPTRALALALLFGIAFALVTLLTVWRADRG